MHVNNDVFELTAIVPNLNTSTAKKSGANRRSEKILPLIDKTGLEKKSSAE